MDWLWFSIAAFGTIAFLGLGGFGCGAIRRQEAYDDTLQPIDFGSLEGDLTHYVHDLNRQ